jgi:hypothetical protein
MAVWLSALCTCHSIPPGPQCSLNRSIEKSNDLIRNRTHDLPSCSIVPQSTTLSCAPQQYISYGNFFNFSCDPPYSPSQIYIFCHLSTNILKHVSSTPKEWVSYDILTHQHDLALSSMLCWHIFGTTCTFLPVLASQLKNTRQSVNFNFFPISLHSIRSRKPEINYHGDPLRWPRDTLYPQNLALTSLTSGSRSVSIVRLRTNGHGV